MQNRNKVIVHSSTIFAHPKKPVPHPSGSLGAGSLDCELLLSVLAEEPVKRKY